MFILTCERSGAAQLRSWQLNLEFLESRRAMLEAQLKTGSPSPAASPLHPDSSSGSPAPDAADRLHTDGLVVKQAAVRGKVGQPSVPIALNPDGAFAIGIKIGRRNCDILLLDFTGKVRERASVSYDFPDPQVLFAQLQTQLIALPARLGSHAAHRIAE